MFEFDESDAAEIRKLLGEAKGNLLILCEDKAGNFDYHRQLAEDDPIRKAIHAIDLISIAFVSDDDEEDEAA